MSSSKSQGVPLAVEFDGLGAIRAEVIERFRSGGIEPVMEEGLDRCPLRGGVSLPCRSASWVNAWTLVLYVVVKVLRTCRFWDHQR